MVFPSARGKPPVNIHAAHAVLGALTPPIGLRDASHNRLPPCCLCGSRLATGSTRPQGAQLRDGLLGLYLRFLATPSIKP